MANTPSAPVLRAGRHHGGADRLFRVVVTVAGSLIVVTLAAVAAFLIYEGAPAFTTASRLLPGGQSIVAYAWPLVFGTLLTAGLALAISLPVSVGVALCISHYAPRRLAGLLGYLVDLLAAVPSVVYGLWGIYFLSPRMVPLFDWLTVHLGFLPLFAGPTSPTGRTVLTVAVVLAIMILPISTALCREVFRQTPRLHEEAALALGATRWEMIRLTVLPHARSGVLSAAMLGLGRALGETMAVAMVLSVSGVVTFDLVGSVNPSTIAANIALKFPEASGLEVKVLIATGLVLFLLTLVVNFAARAVVRRRRDEPGAG